MDTRRRRSSSYDEADENGPYGSQSKTINTRIRIYTLLTVGTILCYMYYGYLSSSFRGFQYQSSGTFSKPEGLPATESEDVPAATVSSAIEVEVSTVSSSLVAAAPTPDSSMFWLANVEHKGVAPYNKDKDYKVFRNVIEFGAKGDGTTDDTDAINAAISGGDFARCGLGCDSSTIAPAIVYFPPGKYLVTRPIIAMYYTQLVGNPLEIPVLLAAKDFSGMAVIDTDPYGAGGKNWYVNQNNFFRGIRNFVIDLTMMDPSEGVG
ncbi:hypothetical protein ABW20_dc0106110 [Dactylellina cionopaga]|nr:hypothetical protein ABW20_dc0106110 [Dactylellina cionopaga]